jgi:hypothetical protein
MATELYSKPAVWPWSLCSPPPNMAPGLLGHGRTLPHSVQPSRSTWGWWWSLRRHGHPGRAGWPARASPAGQHSIHPRSCSGDLARGPRTLRVTSTCQLAVSWVGAPWATCHPLQWAPTQSASWGSHQTRADGTWPLLHLMAYCWGVWTRKLILLPFG